MNGFQTGVKRAKEKHVCELLGELLKKQFGGVPQYEPVSGYPPSLSTHMSKVLGGSAARSCGTEGPNLSRERL